MNFKSNSSIYDSRTTKSSPCRKLKATNGCTRVPAISIKRSLCRSGEIRARVVNSLLRAGGESFRLSPRAIGSVLSSLGFTKRRRTNHGWELIIDLKTRKRIHELVAAYGVDNPRFLPSEEARNRCDLCRTEIEPKGVQTSDRANGQPTHGKQGE
jgi:hypothetical protein